VQSQFATRFIEVALSLLSAEKAQLRNIFGAQFACWKALLNLSVRAKLCIHALPAKLRLLNLFNVFLLNVSVEMGRQVIFVDAQSMLVAIYEHSVTVAFTFVQKQQSCR
jgi:hypothetical protein